MQTRQMQTQFFDMYRSGLKTAADMMIASIENAQRLQQQQFEAVNQMIDEQVKSVRELAEARNFNELLAAQTRLTGSQMERTIDFWNRVWRATSENGFGAASSALSAASNAASTAASTATDATQRIEQAAQQRKVAR